MKQSTDRILTTHTGSLPRPASLVSLYARRSAGDGIDEKEIDAAGLAAMKAVIEQQVDPLARRQLAALVLRINTRLPAAKTGVCAAVFEGIEDGFHGASSRDRVAFETV